MKQNETSQIVSDRVSDAVLCDGVATRIAQPKLNPADSFILHAPLELLARQALLAYVAPADRERVRRRILWLGETFENAGPSVPPPPGSTYESATQATSRLQQAIAAGDFDESDRAATFLAASSTAEEMVAGLADEILPRLAAAAHGSIFLYQLPRVAPRSPAASGMLRGLVRELVRERDWRLSWFDQPNQPTRGNGGLTERLLAPPSPGDPGSPFIYPTMSLVENSGLAADLLAEPLAHLTIDQARRQLTRVAAWSMLQDDPVSAPYGWSHCLSMPQAVLGIGRACRDPKVPLSVAATFALGFRATLGKVRLDPTWKPAPPTRTDWPSALADSPLEAAAFTWHAEPDTLSDLVARLTAYAASHEDAHLAKYTLACLDARADDVSHGRLYLSAAAFLAGWWFQRTGDSESIGL